MTSDWLPRVAARPEGQQVAQSGQSPPSAVMFTAISRGKRISGINLTDTIGSHAGKDYYDTIQQHLHHSGYGGHIIINPEDLWAPLPQYPEPVQESVSLSIVPWILSPASKPSSAMVPEIMTTASSSQAHHDAFLYIDNKSMAGLCRRKLVASRDPSIEKLDVEHNELIRTWREFQEFVPPGDRVNFLEGPQKVENVVWTIQLAKDSWMSERPQRVPRDLITLCDQFITTVGSHSVTMSALPDDTAYSSLFYAVLQSIIQASVKHCRIAKGFLTCLVSINEAVLLFVEEIQRRPISNLVSGITILYCQIFLFLGEFMDSYIRKGNCRLLNSQNEDFQSEFQNLIRSIQCTAHALVRHANGHRTCDDQLKEPRRMHRRQASDLLEEARLSQVGLEGYDRRNASQNKVTRQLIWDIQRQADERRRMEAEKERRLHDLLAPLQSILCCLDDRALETADPMDTTPEDNGAICVDPPHASQGPRHKLPKIALQYSSRDLQDSFNNSDQLPDCEPDVRLLVDADTLIALREWTISLRPQALAISGTSLRCPTFLVSASYVSMSRQNRIPVISHFCSLKQHTSRDDSSAAAQGLVALAYSLIRQLIEIAPPVLDCDSTCDLSADRFRKLDGTLASWKEVLFVLDTLLYFAPPILFCVINGLDLVETPATESFVRSLVHVLVSHIARSRSAPKNPNMNPQGVLLKVLFTTVGQPSSLLAALRKDQLIYTESLHVETVPSGTEVITEDSS